MKIFVIQINGIVQSCTYTSLFGLCQDVGVSYSSVSKGKRLLIQDEFIITITQCKIIKIKGRENNSLKKNNHENI